MAQADYVIAANPTGLAMRLEVNQIFQAILSNNAGTVAPSTTSAGMFWGDMSNTSTYYLKIRNHTNTGWVSLYAYTVATETIQPMVDGITVSEFMQNQLIPIDGGISNIQNQIADIELGLTPLISDDILEPALSLKANVTDMTTALDLKADSTDMATALALKADSTDMATALALKANTTDMATALSLKANLASPALTGTPTAPTAAVGTNTTQIATTEFAKIAASPARYTRTVLFEGSAGTGDISLSAAWDTFDELIFYCSPDSSDWATVVRFDTQDILAAAALSGQNRFLLDFREFWTFYPASNKVVIDTADENSIIKKIIGVKW